MKLMCSLCASFLIAVVLLTVLPVNGEEAIYTDTVRLHVIAASDDEDEQALKIKVRDEVLAYVSELICDVRDNEEAAQIINGHLEEINGIAEQTVKDNGHDHKTETVMGTEKYPVREYEDFTLPAGEYTSLQIKIGNAEGKNWWCILFPPLCTTAASEQEEAFVSAGFTGEQYKVITKSESGKYKVKFKILEILEDIFS